MKHFLFILFILSSFALAAQNSFQEKTEEAKEILEQLDTAKGSLYRQSIQTLQTTNRGVSVSYIEEALKAGYGTSIWDKPGEFYPGMNVQKQRKINKQTFFLNVFELLSVTALAFFLIYIVIYLIKKQRNKES